MTPEKRTEKLREQAAAVASLLLAAARNQIASPVTIRRVQGGVRVRIAIRSRDEPDDAPPGRFFSTLERRLFDAATGHPPPLGKELAAAAGVKYTREVRVLLSNLVERGCLIQQTRGQGYVQAD